MEIERGTDSGLSGTPWSQAMPTAQEAGRTSTAPQAGAPRNTVKVGLERAGAYVKDAWPVTAKVESSWLLRTSSRMCGVSRRRRFSLRQASAWSSECSSPWADGGTPLTDVLPPATAPRIARIERSPPCPSLCCGCSECS